MADKPVPPPKRPMVAFGTLKGEVLEDKPAPPPKPPKKPMGGVALPFAGGIPLQNILKKPPVIPAAFVPPPLPPAPKPAPEFFEPPPNPPAVPVDDDEPPPLPSQLPPNFAEMEDSDDGEYASDSDHDHGDKSDHEEPSGKKPRPESNADLPEKSQSQHDSQSMHPDLTRDSTYSRIGGTEVSHQSALAQEADSKWMRFTSKDGDELIYNPYSHVVRLPKDPVDDDARSTRAEFSQMRRNSAILGEAWEANRKTMAPVTEMSLEACADSLAKMIRQAERVLNTDGLPAETVEELKAVLARMKTVHGVVQDNKIGNDDRTDVDAVLDIRHLPWDFKNEMVDWYRAASTKKDRYEESAGLVPFNDWHFPQYFSDFPIPADTKQVNCVIRLPIPVDNINNPWKASFKVNEPVAKCISQVFHKVKGRGFGHESEYVLKATGLNEFLRPAKTLGSYAYVRRCLRDREDVRLTLVKKPKPSETEEADLNLEGYKKKIKEEVVSEVKTEDHYADFSITDLDWGEVQQIPISDLNIPFKYKLVGLDQLDPVSLPRLQDSEMKVVYLETFMFVGMEKISPVNTNAFPLTDTIRLLQPMMGESGKDPLYSNLARNARLGFILWGVDVEDNPVRLAWVVMQLIDHHDVLASGMVTLRMWAFPGKKKSKHKVREVDPDFIFRATNRENRSTNHTPLLHLEFDRFAMPVVAPQAEQYTNPNVRVVGAEYSVKRLDKEQTKTLANIIKQDSLFVLEPAHRDLVWLLRHSLVSYPSMLPKFLQSVKWGNPHFRHEAHRLLTLWSPPTAMADALELLDARYADYKVRQYAVSCLARLEDEELQLYLLQLTQCLKFEPYHHSPLSRFLVRRAIQSPFLIGHHFFWHLKAELHNPEFAERFTLLLEEFMSNCGRYAGELRKQHNAVLKMQRIAGLIVRLKREEGYADEQAMKEYAKELAKLNRGFFEPMGKFQIPLDPRWEAKTLIIEKCRYMSSKMVPLWLVFKNADEEAPPLYLIFKSGDDLRQDILTLQMLRIMDKLWLADGLDMRLKPYKCIATGVNEAGEGVGMIEVVLNSDTTSGIQLKYGGGAMGALKLDPIDQFLHAHNDSPKLYEAAVENFVASCAGYCVATYVLGIGDRHNGNIMVTKDGHLFHIDFGHFLGNFKKKFGINRERAAFVFTPEMAYVMGGRRYRKSPQFKDFLKYCSRGYAILRKNAPIMETLFILMVSAGMPELMVEKDVAYLQEKLQLDVSEKKADKILHLEIDKSLDSTYRRFDNMIHNFKHG